MAFVLDASVSLTWLLDDASPRHRSQAFSVLNRLRAEAGVAHVPVTWSLEIANVIARAEGKGLVAEAHSTAFLELLSALPIAVDADTAARSLTETLQLARRYRLSSYDASYLELAMRMGLPLATLDTELRRAAPKAGVKLIV
ncbi:MAG: type II toxin-antitoxin system VapC family toxin [Gammaproteobacteria bacterium]|nr:type II toxin-antitoxin system VapC family toxin [Gammaproteobacteria bacterium]